jgi:2-polyprenyl-3-methyl-5-hydroxy-6-metoxy-1,4-benzoquinol methylase
VSRRLSVIRANQTNINDRAYWNSIYKKEHETNKARIDETRLVALSRWVRIREEELQRPAAILDVGCGFGEALHYLERPGRTLSGVDVASFAIQENQSAFGAHGSYFWRVGGAHQLAELWTAPAFDIVWCGETLEHVEDPAAAIRAMAAVCHQQSFIVLSTPFKARNVSPEHVWEFEPKDMHDLATLVGELVHLDCCLLPSWLTMFAVIRVGGAT